MNILDLAIDMEEQTEKHYRDMAKKLAENPLKDILSLMADEEAHHAKQIRIMKDKMPIVADRQVLAKAKNFFMKMKDIKPTFTINDRELELYTKMRDMEKESERTYRSYAKELDDDKSREALLLLADEEKKHYIVIENLLNFIKRPEEWIENAEWNHLDSY